MRLLVSLWPQQYSLLREYDPTFSGMSRIRHSESNYKDWQSERSADMDKLYIFLVQDSNLWLCRSVFG